MLVGLRDRPAGFADRFGRRADEEVANRLPHGLSPATPAMPHSPKAGQGMNVSCRTRFNLGWHLASRPIRSVRIKILHTYSAERQARARELIVRPRVGQKGSAALKSSMTAKALDPAEVQEIFRQAGHYPAGPATKYKTSLIPPNRTSASGQWIGSSV